VLTTVDDDWPAVEPDAAKLAQISPGFSWRVVREWSSVARVSPIGFSGQIEDGSILFSLLAANWAA
jgi:hypothetical protein